jgi:hypothetical protein
MSDLAYVSLVFDEAARGKIPDSHIHEWDAGKWRGEKEMNVRWDTVGAAIATHPVEQGLFLGARGEVMCLGSRAFHFEKIGKGADSPEKRGPMRGIRGVGESVFAVGMNRQIYKRDSAGVWSTFEKGLPKRLKGSDEVTGFEAIDGFDETELYTVGWDGEIRQFDGTAWINRDSPTNFILTDVCCAGNGVVYACGRVGTLLAGRADQWRSLTKPAFKDDLWSLAWFQGQLYAASMTALYVLEKESFRPVRIGKDAPETCFRLSARDGVLWSIGAKDVMAYDGKKWTRID